MRIFITLSLKEAHNLQPVMLNDATDGKAWEEHDVWLQQILNRNRNTADGSQTLWEYSLNRFIRPNVEKGRIKDSEKRKDSI